MPKIIIETTRRSSGKDFDDLRILLEELSKKYNFRWHLGSKG